MGLVSGARAAVRAAVVDAWDADGFGFTETVTDDPSWTAADDAALQAFLLLDPPDLIATAGVPVADAVAALRDLERDRCRAVAG